jgi:tellurite resistance protein TehA-like permease
MEKVRQIQMIAMAILVSLMLVVIAKILVVIKKKINDCARLLEFLMPIISSCLIMGSSIGFNVLIECKNKKINRHPDFHLDDGL